ncbi:hypothetical protein G6F61_009917 [Rhizopus arrhizus]|nr:hypothetical protein G6F61_009917 [Rhizopus arrhizus]
MNVYNKTQVATVIDYYNRWMTAFPTIHSLAKADLEKVNTLWAGLGYYSRAKRLWEGAKKIVSEFDGRLPNNAQELQREVPGVGRYTAGAVASIVFGEATPVVDGNVIRVLSRWRAIHADPKKAKTVELFWGIAASIVPESNPGDFNQAMMELGARVCVPQNPNCNQCPISNNCHAFNQLQLYKSLSKNGFFNEKKRKQMESEHECEICDEIQSDLNEDAYAVTRYPLKVEKKPPRDEECAVSIVERIRSNGDDPLYLISKRPETGLLAGLWEFPSVELTSPNTNYSARSLETTNYLKMKYSIELEEPTRHDLGNVVHLFSHIRKVYHVEWVQYESNDEPMESEEIKWVTMSELQKAPIPTGLKKALKLFEKFKTTTPTKLTKKTTVRKSVKSAAISSFFTFRLDPFPRFTELALNSLFNARILIFSVVVAKITLDRLYRYAVIINPLGIDENGEAMLDILEYQSPSSANDVFYALNSYGPKGRQAYLTYLFYDVIFVLSRTVPFTVLCSYAYKKAPQAVRPGVWMPLLNTAVDLLESFLLFVLLKLFPTRVEGLELLTAYVIQLKWLTFKATLAIMFISLFVGIYYAFHSLLADSVLMEKDRKQKSNARENVQNVLHQSAARRAAAAKKDS